MVDAKKQEYKMKRLSFFLLLVISPVSSAHADTLGRLFFTPEQRAQLESNHKRNSAADSEQTSVLTVNGIVQHGGVRTVWINGAAKNSAHGGKPAAEAVVIPGKSKTIQIKVGEKLLLDAEAPQISPASAQ
jgi:hypothetical protein